MKKRVLLSMLSCMLMISAIPANVFADDAGPGLANTTTTMDQAGSSATSVYADINSSYVVTLPKTIKLDSTTKDAQYTVNVKGALAGTEIIKVIPDTSFTMKQDGKDDVTATITQAKTDFTSAELAADTENGVTETGTVAAPDISAGRWDGSFNFNVSKSMVSGLYKPDGSYVTWQSLLDDGTFTVTDGTLTSDIDKVSVLSGDLYVDESVTALGTQAFSGCSALTEVKLPSTLQSIGDGAFYDCAALEDLVVPDSVTTITTDAFKNVKHVTYHGTAVAAEDNANWGAVALN